MTTAKKETTPSQFRDIAEHIAAILSDPHTPEALYLGIVDGLMKLDTDISTHESVGYVETILLVNDTSEKAVAARRQKS
jgi:hypothetical protein